MIISEKFTNDVASNNISVIPMVVFEKSGVTLAVSTHNTSFKDESGN